MLFPRLVVWALERNGFDSNGWNGWPLALDYWRDERRMLVDTYIVLFSGKLMWWK